MVMLLLVDESVSVSSDGNGHGETGQFGFMFRGRIVSKVSGSVMVPESHKCLLVL